MSTNKSFSRPRGAPKGNRNALKHGLYARRYSPADRKELGAMPPLDSTSEIYMLRTQLNAILTLIAACEDDERKVKLFNSLFTGIQRLLSAMRTHYKLNGKDDGPDLFWETVAEVQQELGLADMDGAPTLYQSEKYRD